MANGDITKEIEYDKIEVVNTWAVQVRQATIILEEQADGSKKELTRNFHRHAGEDASVQAICNAAWTDAVKTAYKAAQEAQAV